MVVTDANYNALAYPGTANPSSSGSWVYQSTTYTIPAGAAYVALYAQIYLPTSSTVLRVDDGFLGNVSVWSQTFSYDAFGNISKNGSATFAASYNSATNQISSVGGFTPTYDADGNTLTDPAHTYSWDSAGKPVTIDTVNMTYDALGRMVEQNQSGVYTQFVYGPHGGKLAIMSGQTLRKAVIPLVGGAQAVYNASGLLYYGHADHLGSIRLGTTPTRTMSFDIAYAPFGETYASSGTVDPAFTGQRQDTVAGLFDFPAREYSNEGRWSSPDPAGIGAASITDPQTLNRYAYARNNPLVLTDPAGLSPMVCRDTAACDPSPGSGCMGASETCSSGGFSWYPDDQAFFAAMETEASGYDEFDAIAGAPGTYYSYTNGRFSWGFSRDLYVATMNYIDLVNSNGVNGCVSSPPSENGSARACTSLNLRSDIGYQVLSQDFGGTQILSGFIPDLGRASAAVSASYDRLFDEYAIAMQWFDLSEEEAYNKVIRDNPQAAANFPYYVNAVQQFYGVLEQYLPGLQQQSGFSIVVTHTGP